MARLQTLRSTLAVVPRRIAVPPKQADPHYSTADHQRWRAQVIERAGGRCEAITKTGERCRKAQPRHRMFADHKDELQDDGASLDPANGRCLCGSHHSAKTAQSRAARR